MYRKIGFALLATALASCASLKGLGEDEFRKAAESFPVQPVSATMRERLNHEVKFCVGNVTPYDTSDFVKRLDAGEKVVIPPDFRWAKSYPLGHGENEVFPNAVVLPRTAMLLASLQVGKVIPTCTPESIRVDVRVGTVFKKTVPQQLLTHISLDFWYAGQRIMDVGRDWDTTKTGSIGPRELKEVLDREFSWLAIEAKIKWRRVVIDPDNTSRTTKMLAD